MLACVLHSQANAATIGALGHNVHHARWLRLPKQGVRVDAHAQPASLRDKECDDEAAMKRGVRECKGGG